MNIKPCPFCGGEGLFIPASVTSYVVECTKCVSSGREYFLPHYSSKQNVVLRLKFKCVTAWNRRHYDNN